MKVFLIVSLLLSFAISTGGCSIPGAVRLVPRSPTSASTSTPYPKRIQTPKPPTPTPLPYTIYEPSQYKVGVDIPAGEYILLATSSGARGYFCISSDANKDDIIENDNFYQNSIITIDDGQYLELTRCSAIAFDKYPNTYQDMETLSEGMYKVGYHLPAGEYKLEATGDKRGYYCIYPNSYQNDILSNENFEGSRYVTVQDGQYLKLTRCILYK